MSRHSIASLSIMSLECSLNISVLSSSNGFPMLSITSTSELSCLANSLWVASVCSWHAWWFIWLALSLFSTMDASNSEITWVSEFWSCYSPSQKSVGSLCQSNYFTFILHHPIILLMTMVNGDLGEFSLRLDQYELAILEFLSNIRVCCIEATHISYMNWHPSGVVNVV